MNSSKGIFNALRREARYCLKGVIFTEENGILPQGIPYRQTRECQRFQEAVLRTLSMKGTKP